MNWKSGLSGCRLHCVPAGGGLLTSPGRKAEKEPEEGPGSRTLSVQLGKLRPARDSFQRSQREDRAHVLTSKSGLSLL